MDHPIFINCIKSIEFPCSSLTTSTGFTPLMYLVINTKEYPELNDLIVNFRSTINQQNIKGWSALMLAARNSNTVSSIETIKILIELGFSFER